MIPGSRPTRRRWRVLISALLLSSQTSFAALTPVAHGGESFTAPSGIEAEHGKACVVLHDAARCPSCQVSGVATLPRPTRAPGTAIADRHSPPTPSTHRSAHQLDRTAQPRAPPAPPV